jgi:CubicO group peptidase (beta-lactamase class C family)
MKNHLLICLCFFLCMESTAQTGTYVPELANFDAAMQNLLTSYNVPGAQLAITYQGRLVYNRGFGFANVVEQDSVYPNNLFRIASVSKPITGLACMKLMEEGLLDLDARVFGENGILNDPQYLDILDARDTTITVRMLLQHSGGWNSSSSGDPMFNAFNIASFLGVASPPSPTDMIQYMLSQVYLDFTPGTQYQYSNFGYCVLGRVIEKMTNQSYENYVLNEILIPLEITDMTMGRNLEEDQEPSEVKYYDYPGAPLAYSVYNNSTLVPWPYGGFNLEFMDAHGGWIASAESLVKLTCAFDLFDTRPDFLSEATIETLITPSANNPNYANGIGVNAFNNWWHMGSLPGTTSEIVRNGNGQLNWAILLNTRDANGNINTAVDNLVWNVLPSISTWPSFDLFSSGPNQVDESIKVTQTPLLFPNPTATNRLNIDFGTTQERDMQIAISNAMGQLVHSHNLGRGSDRYSIQLPVLPAGMYGIRITNKEGMISHQTFQIQ